MYFALISLLQVQLTESSTTEIAVPLLRVVGNIISISNAYTDQLLQSQSFVPYIRVSLLSDVR